MSTHLWDVGRRWIDLGIVLLHRKYAIITHNKGFSHQSLREGWRWSPLVFSWSPQSQVPMFSPQRHWDSWVHRMPLLLEHPFHIGCLHKYLSVFKTQPSASCNHNEQKHTGFKRTGIIDLLHGCIADTPRVSSTYYEAYRYLLIYSLKEWMSSLIPYCPCLLWNLPIALLVLMFA